MSAGPPRLAELLLGLSLPADVRDEALDDLADLHRDRMLSVGRGSANRWYWGQLPRFALRIRMAVALGGPLDGPGPRVLPDPPGDKAMNLLLSDLRHGARALRRTPGFTAIAVATLALGIGATASIASVVRSVLLRPLPFPQPERLVALNETRVERDMFNISFTYANFWDVHDMNRTFDAVGAIRFASRNLGGDGEPARLTVASPTVGFLRALGVRPVVGRLFIDGEDRTGNDPRIALLSHAFWNSRFGADSAVVGKTVLLDNESYQVVGILPPGTPWLNSAEIFTPFVRPAQLDRDSWELPVIGRLKPGVPLAAAQADLDRIAAQLSSTYPEAKGMGIAIQPSERWMADDSVRRALWVLAGSVVFLLLIACVNLANMLLARSTTRARERALRSALGASRARVVQLALTESGLLGALGGALGLLLAFGVVRLLRTYNPGDIPRLADASVDGWIVMLTLGAALLTSLVTGLVPVLRMPFDDMVTALREGERNVGHRRGGRVRNALVTVEVALSLVLLVGAGLLIRSFDRVLSVDRGFKTSQRIVFSVGFPNSRTAADENRSGQLLIDYLAQVRAMPQVSSAAVVHMRPMNGTGTGMGFGAVDRPDATGKEIPWAGWRIVSNDYFKTLGLSVIAGRDFTEHDRIGEPWKVIISNRIAKLLWRDENAIGRQLVLWKGQGQSMGEVIGVVSDMRDWSLTDDPSYSVYLPTYGTNMSPANYVVHSSLPSATLLPLLRARLAELDRALPISDVQTLDEVVGASVASRRFTMLLLAALAAVALVMALAGVYGVLSYAVSQRRSEVGVRMALGASNRSVLRLIVGQGMRPVMIGLVVGIAGALWLSRAMSTLLFDVTAADWPTYAAVAMLLAGAAALACYVPARSALRVDVTATLREE
jgi:putative ABC transport system permease protein